MLINSQNMLINSHPWAHLAGQKAEALTGYLLWLLLRAGTRGAKVKGTPKNAVINSVECNIEKLRMNAKNAG